MDGKRFDDLTRRLAGHSAGVVTRRTAVKAAAAGLLGALGLRGATAQVSCGNVLCTVNPGVCKPGCVCCAYPNGNSRCRPAPECTGSGVILVPTTTTTAAPTTTTSTTAAPTTTTTTTTSTTSTSATTSAPTTTTTTAAPTTTTTTTAAPTSTTTTTAAPSSQGTCAAGEDRCAVVSSPPCNGNAGCYCITSMEGATVCVTPTPSSACGQCTTSADCGPGGVCARTTGTGCGCLGGEGFCQAVCPPAPLSTTTTTTAAPSPNQGTCAAGEDRCTVVSSPPCNANDGCYCITSMEGATVCVTPTPSSACGQCTTSADCGPGGVCARTTGTGCGCLGGEGFCQAVCPPA